MANFVINVKSMLEISNSRDIHEPRPTAAESLAQLNLSILNEITADSATLPWNATIRPETEDPLKGALTAIIASGTFALIKNRFLRSHLAGWKAGLADYNHAERNLAGYILIRSISSTELLNLS